MIILGVIALHAFCFWFLKHFEGVPMVSYVTLGFSAAGFGHLLFGDFRFSPKIWTGIFAILLVLQPAWVLRPML